MPSVMDGGDYEQRASVLFGRPTSQAYSGGQGAQTVPLEFSRNFFLGLAQYSPLLNADNVTLEVSDSYALRSVPAAMWDLSNFAAVRVGGSGYGDAVQQTAQTVPVLSESFLQGYIYKATLDAALELFQDDPKLVERIAAAYAVGFGRGIGTDLSVGSGVGEIPQGLLTGAVDCGLSIGTGVEMAGGQPSGNVTAEDLLGVYFSLNRIYRASPKCAWVMSDRAYQRVRNSVDNYGRPLLKIAEDGEVLLGKKVLVDPNIPDGYGSSPHVSGSIVFGDLSYFRVLCSQLSISKVAQVGGGIEAGIFKLIGRQRASSMVCDPTNGANSPIIKATLM
jgi:HK97 family phage major capsid protein